MPPSQSRLTGLGAGAAGIRSTANGYTRNCITKRGMINPPWLKFLRSRGAVALQLPVAKRCFSSRSPLWVWAKPKVLTLHRSNVAKYLTLAAIGKKTKPAFQKVGGFGVHLLARIAAQKVFQRVRVGIILALINLARRNTVAKHLFHITHRHFHRFI